MQSVRQRNITFTDDRVNIFNSMLLIAYFTTPFGRALRKTQGGELAESAHADAFGVLKKNV